MWDSKDAQMNVQIGQMRKLIPFENPWLRKEFQDIFK